MEMKLKNMNESQLQQQCVKWFNLQYPKLILFAIPNGGNRNPREAFKLKREGTLSGVSDLFLAEPTGRSHGLFIEMKVKPNKMTSNQITFAKRVQESNYHFECCYSFDAFIKIITNYLTNDI